ncbi:hypothetical protein KIL84_022730, partial [Mauremys mutica]
LPRGWDGFRKRRVQQPLQLRVQLQQSHPLLGVQILPLPRQPGLGGPGGLGGGGGGGGLPGVRQEGHCRVGGGRALRRRLRCQGCQAKEFGGGAGGCEKHQRLQHHAAPRPQRQPPGPGPPAERQRGAPQPQDGTPRGRRAQSPAGCGEAPRRRGGRPRAPLGQLHGGHLAARAGAPAPDYGLGGSGETPGRVTVSGTGGTKPEPENKLHLNAVNFNCAASVNIPGFGVCSLYDALRWYTRKTVRI